MSILVKQSTAYTFRIGPFLDETNGFTQETALTIAKADIRFSKDGGDFIPLNAAESGLTHDEAGWYILAIDTTDTNTLGSLIIAIHVSGALPVWVEYEVVPADVFDTLIDGTDALPAQVEGMDANVLTATAINAAAITSTKFASGAIDAAAIAANAIGASELASDAVDEIVDQVWDELQADHVTAATFGILATEIADILIDTDTTIPGTITTLQADTDDIQTRLPAALVGGAMDSDVSVIQANVITATAINADAITAAKVAADVHAETADAVWDEDLSGHIGITNAGAVMSANSVRTNQAAAGAATSITLDASASTTVDIFKGMMVIIFNGTGVGQARLITAYSSGRVATVDPAWATNPDATSDFLILPRGAVDVGLWRTEVPNNLTIGGVDANVTRWQGGTPSGLSGGAVASRMGSTLTDAITASSLSDSAIDKIVDQVWDEAQADHVAASSFGLLATEIADILIDTGTTLDGRIPAALVGGRMDSDVAIVQTDAIDAASINADTDEYQAKVWLIDDDSGSNDRYVVAWFQNGAFLAAPAATNIQVIKASDGTDLVADTAMTAFATDFYRYDEGTNRVVDGAAYIAKVTATLGGSSRTWVQPVGRDG